MKKKIQAFDLKYWLLKIYVRFAIRQFYGKICIEGKENIPEDKNKAVIYAPNHQNALMDALLMLYLQPGSTVFLARADIFKKKKIAKILHFLKMLPIYRIRDGRDELDKNFDIFNQSVDVLRDGIPLCLMPEGKQSFRRSLLPLVKGMFRIAFQAQQEIQDKDVVIIPTGIDYTDYINSGADVVIRLGKPIEVKSYLPVYEESQPKGLNALRDDVSAAMAPLIQNIRSEKYYQEFYGLSTIADDMICEKDKQEKTPSNLLNARKKLTVSLDQAEIKDPEQTATLCELYNTYSSRLKSLKINHQTIQQPLSLIKIILKIAGLVVSFPLFFSGWIANCIPAYTPRLIVKKLKDDSFKSSFNFVLWLFLYLLYYIFSFCIIGFLYSWISGLAIIICMALSGKFAYFYSGWRRDLLCKIRHRTLNKKNQYELEEMSKNILKILSRII